MSDEKKIKESDKSDSKLKKEKNEQRETKPANSNEKPATENMEVHKHPHHVTHKKKWGEYFNVSVSI